MVDASKIVVEGLLGASSLASAQVSSKVLTFLANVYLARAHVDRATLGVASINLFLLYTVLLTLSREGVRRTCLRVAAEDSTVKDHNSFQDMVNLGWWCLMAGLLLTPMFCTYFIWQADVKALEVVELEEYAFSLQLIGLSVLTELLSEAMFVAWTCARLDFVLRSKVETIANLVRNVVQVGLVVVYKMKLSAFAYGYVAYSFVVLALYAQHTYGHDGNFHKVAPKDSLWIKDKTLSRLALRLSFQQVWKLMLAEGEKIVMMVFTMDASSQAVYALVFNLGSLLARFAFQPIEESAFAVFGKLNDLSLRQKYITKRKDGEEVTLAMLFQSLAQTMSIIGLTIFAFGPSYSHLLLHILYGDNISNETNAADALAFYCGYVLIIAINGVFEAFVHSVATQKELDQYNYWLLFFSIVYLSSAVVLVDYKAMGLIAANCVNMIMRIVYCLYVISKWRDPASKEQIKLSGLFPSPLSLAGFAGTAFIVHMSNAHIYKQFTSFTAGFLHVAIGGISLIGLFTFVAFFSERGFVGRIKAIYAYLVSSKREKSD